MMDAASLAAALPHPVMVIRADQRVTLVNPALITVLGTDPTNRHFVTALRQPGLIDVVERVLENGVGREGIYLTRDAGRDSQYIVRVRPIEDNVLLIFEDASAEQDMGQLRRDFVANVSHELRTPLTSLTGFIETLQGAARDDPPARARFLRIMEREAGRMTQLVDDLLSLSRVEVDERVRPSQSIDLPDLIRSTISDLAPMLAGAQATVRFEDASGGVTLPGDRNQIRQVLGNLIENAVKYGAPQGEVMVTLAKPRLQPDLRGEGVRLTITDKGQGIAAHHLPRLTERFYRVDTHRSREIGGTGLGLAIVKHIVNRHRGRLRITSTQGEGTEVAIILPIAMD